MISRRSLTMAALALGACCLLETAPARAEAPKVTPAARQQFVALLTSVKPAKKVKTSTGSLRAFAGRGFGSPTRP